VIVKIYTPALLIRSRKRKSKGCFENIFAVYLSENKSMTKEFRLMLLLLSAHVYAIPFPIYIFSLYLFPFV